MNAIELCKVELKQYKDGRLYYRVLAPHGSYLYYTLDEMLNELPQILKFVDSCIQIDLQKQAEMLRCLP